MLRIILFIIWVSFFNLVSAQESSRILYRRSNEFFPEIHSYSWGVGWRHLRHKTWKYWLGWEVGLAHLKHPKEARIQPLPAFGDAACAQSVQMRSYVYGKQNDFWALRTSFVNSFLLFDAAEEGGVSVKLLTNVGVSLGLLKPYYLYVVKIESDNSCSIEPVKYDSTIHPLANPFLDTRYIYGSAGLTGLGETKLRPGILLQASLVFNWAEEPAIRSIEVGTRIEHFIKPVPIMALIENRSMFAALFLRITFGKLKNPS